MIDQHLPHTLNSGIECHESVERDTRRMKCLFTALINSILKNDRFCQRTDNTYRDEWLSFRLLMRWQPIILQNDLRPSPLRYPLPDWLATLYCPLHPSLSRPIDWRRSNLQWKEALSWPRRVRMMALQVPMDPHYVGIVQQMQRIIAM